MKEYQHYTVLGRHVSHLKALINLIYVQQGRNLLTGRSSRNKGWRLRMWPLNRVRMYVPKVGQLGI